MKVVLITLLLSLISGRSFRAFIDCFTVHQPDPGLSLTNVRTFAQDALTFHVDAGHDLNWYDGNRHALTLAIFQLRSPNAFQQLVKSKFGIRNLLESDELENSFLARHLLPVQPGTWREIVLDRMEGTAYIGVVAGFYEGNKQFQSQLIALPIVTKPRKNIPVISWLTSAGSEPLQPAQMLIRFSLDRNRITRFSSSIVHACTPKHIPPPERIDSLIGGYSVP